MNTIWTGTCWATEITVEFLYDVNVLRWLIKATIAPLRLRHHI